MRTKPVLLIAAAVLAVAGTLASWNRGPREPEWNGRTFSAWWTDLYSLSEPSHSAAAVARRAPAQRAMGEFGVTVLPHIIDRMRAPDTEARLLADEWFTRTGLRQHPFPPGAAEHGRAMFAFQAIGPAGADAIPHLRLMLDDPRLTQAAAISLGWIGPKSLPALAEAAQHREAWVRYWGTIGLGWLGEGARPAVPKLLAAFTTEADPQVRSAIAWTLLRVRSELPASLNVLAGALRAPDADVTPVLADWLGDLGPLARPVLADLRAASRATTGDLRQRIDRAIRRIEAADVTTAPRGFSAVR
ncbi:MAG: hypothetical protein FJ386_15275 [Verrucomicrobia bacterium]|nr:hypothetical protein [Verrucomicrobiota bacterium]